MKCKMCKQTMSARDVATYGNRCEDCWSGGPPVGKGGFLERKEGAAEACCGPSRMLQSLHEVSNQYGERVITRRL